ncbi:MAG: hypothetical protein CVV02_08750 [Firmicutes bacterium HGW-Firmicutes-7]|nr:MAG: hypothetical protein CVV02_08750 [Firmicutes bacterium HGW-Firmicutes-7]
MKVVSIYLGRKGGGALYSYEMTKALSNKAEVLYIVSKQAENIGEIRAISKGNFELYEMDTYMDIKSLIVSTLKVGKFLKMRRRVREFNPTIIYHPMSHTWTFIINYFLKKYKKVLTIHDPVSHLGEKNIIMSFTHKIEIKQCDRFVILSKIFIEELIRQGINHQMITVIPHGIFDNYKRTKFEEKTYQMRLLFFGRISEYKGVGVLLEAFKIIKREVVEASLLVVGSGDMSKYDKLVKETDGIEVVNQWITDEEVEKYFNKTDILVVPYIDASQSGVILTAYGFNMPVIATKIGGLPEQVVNKETGILVEPNNVEDLANACISLLNQPEMVKSMGKNAYDFANEKYNWNVLSDSLMKSFMRL